MTDPATDNALKMAQMIYYTGAGTILTGTGIRFLYKFFKQLDNNAAFLKELKSKHIPEIYAALKSIDQRLNQIPRQ